MNDGYYYYSQNDYNGTLDPAVATAIMLGTLFFAIVAYVVTAIFLSMVFKKAGVEGWKAWVPVYNTWVLLELGDKPGWISLLSLGGIIPFVGFIPAIVAAVFIYMAMYTVGLKFGKSGAFVLLAIFLPLVWVIWLAVDKTAVWKGQSANVQAVPAGPAEASAPVNETSNKTDSDSTSSQPPSASPSA
ncbi:MAG TPA: DUF5684 domain-containing protein [Candidatus Saccharibacteria bacterium]|nr:DUF5684 domain-containing protein [Candidatus Saccharibacteria bacterium]HRK93933.1 DUF5684 domain-containing protein [Candidatus Saccharibacteria bacterium]